MHTENTNTWGHANATGQANSPIQFIDLQAQRQRIQKPLTKAIARVMNHGQFILGPEVQELEQRLCDYTGAKYAVSCANGTDALVLLLMAKGIKPNDVVFVPAFTFAATAEAVAILGAIPYFVDIDPTTFNMDPLSLLQAISEAESKGMPIKGVIAVDLFGLPADYQSLHDITRSHDLWLMADAAQSFGGSSGLNTVGSLTETTATSFFPSKPLGAYGDGGCVFTSNEELANTIRSLRAHGAGENRYDHRAIGMNSRLDTLQAVVILEKLKIFEEELIQRHTIANYYAQHLEELVEIPVVNEATVHAYGLYTVRIPGHQRDGVAALLKTENIPSAVYYKTPLHRQSAYQNYPRVNGALPMTDLVSEEVLSLPMHPYLSEEQCSLIVQTIHKALS